MCGPTKEKGKKKKDGSEGRSRESEFPGRGLGEEPTKWKWRAGWCLLCNCDQDKMATNMEQAWLRLGGFAGKEFYRIIQGDVVAYIFYEVLVTPNSVQHAGAFSFTS